MMIYFTSTDLLIELVALVIALAILWIKKKSSSYLLFFAIFWIYMIGVVSVVVFPFPIGIPNSNFKPDINLVPFDFGYCHPEMLSLCIRNLYGNILLTIPFGFGVSFIARIKPKNIFWLAIAVGFTFELVQLFISFAIRSSFRAVDVNDVILNAAGVLLGYAFFRFFAWVYLKSSDHFNIVHKRLFEDIYDVAFQAQASGKPNNT